MSAEISSERMAHKAHCFLTCGKTMGKKKKKWRPRELTGRERRAEQMDEISRIKKRKVSRRLR